MDCKLIFLILLLWIDFAMGEEVHCVLIHGAGFTPEDERDLRVQRDIDDLPQKLLDYWGNVKKWGSVTTETSPACTSYAFTYVNTVKNQWYDDNLASAACEALDDKATTQRVFLHSMGNLIYFNAIRQYCNINGDQIAEINMENTNVYSFGGPMLGSEMTLAVRKACAVTHTVGEMKKQESVQNVLSDMRRKFRGLEVLSHIITSTVEIVKEQPTVKDAIKGVPLVDMCDVNTGKLTPAFESIAEITPHGVAEILELSEIYTKGAICGVNGDENSVLNKSIRRFNITDDLNDGAVPLKSCMAVSPQSSWSENDESDFWIAPFNHNEIIGRSGEEQVINWLANRK